MKKISHIIDKVGQYNPAIECKISHFLFVIYNLLWDHIKGKISNILHGEN